MLAYIDYQTASLDGAFLYYDDTQTEDGIPLIVYLTGGLHGCHNPDEGSLGAALENNDVICDGFAVLLPIAKYGLSYGWTKAEELLDIIDDAKRFVNIDDSNISICGWSLGSEAASWVVKTNPDIWSRVCLISNRPKGWNNMIDELNMPILFVAGAKEKSASDGEWPITDKLTNAEMRIYEGYDHMVGDKIWFDTDEIINWLIGKDMDND